jgi:hypothetical protein
MPTPTKITALAFRRSMNKIGNLQQEATKANRVYEYTETTNLMDRLVTRCGGILKAIELAKAEYDGDVPEWLYHRLQAEAL